MSEAGFCSAWTDNAVDRSLAADSDVIVTVTNGTTDLLTVSSAACPFTFGSINLGSNLYVSGATGTTATFNGTGTGVSTINWTSSTRTLVITLGTKATGTVANVATAVSPVYTAAPSDKDVAGAVVGNSPFTLTPAVKLF